ncbi:MAG: IS66 family transposase [Planctomycetes bacterium]|nr:IS66 family transposase [Planctomycetota bacterium]
MAGMDAKDRKIERLERLVAEQAAMIEKLSQRVEELERQLAMARKDSSNSSKPPSSDIVKKPKDRRGGGRKRRRKQGGQKGHPKHERSPFLPQEIDGVWDYALSVCPNCGGKLDLSDKAPKVVQQIEITEKPIRIDEHRGLAYWCSACQKIHYAPFPAEVEKGQLLGPRLTILVAYMKGVCHCSFTTIRRFFRDVLTIQVSRGQLAKTIAKVTESMKSAYAELVATLPSQGYVRSDETGHKENGKRFWTWCFRTDIFTLFWIDKSRGSQVLYEVLGADFEGVLSCDYFSAYRKYMGELDLRVQFCLAHLIRDMKYLTTLSDKRTQAYGKRLLDTIREMFRTLHRRDELTKQTVERRLAVAREDLVAKATKRVPPSREAQNMAKRFLKHGDAFFEFITTPGIDPTNNLAEQAIRFVVLDRKVTQGTRSEKGRQWSECIWTAIATCEQTGRHLMQFLQESLFAHWQGLPPPSLLPATH